MSGIQPKDDGRYKQYRARLDESKDNMLKYCNR